MRWMIFLIVCSLVLLSGCGRIQRPDAPICWLVYDEILGALEKGCYNMRTDYDDNGYRKKTATPVITYITSLKELDMHFITTAQGYVRSTAYIEKLKRYCK